MERDIDYVIAVAECRSISKAAEVLYISQPSLSRYLSNLEQELGVSLFVRTLNGTELTEAGKIYVKYAKEIRLLRSTMESKIRDFKRTGEKKIRIGMTLNAASLSAFNVVEAINRKYPDCRVEIFNILSKDVCSELKKGTYNFAVGPNVAVTKDFTYEILYNDPYILLVPVRYDLTPYVEYRPGLKFPYLDLRRLPPLDYILQENTTFVRKSFDRICRNLRLSITPRMLVTSSTLAIQAAENGIGCCIAVVGHLAYLNQPERLNFYQISDTDHSSAGVIHLRSRMLSEEEVYCISCIKKALVAGENEILRRLDAAGKLIQTEPSAGI